MQGAITPTRLLNLPLALWRDSAGQVHAWEDRCPHRGTPFSLGSVEGDSVRCAYHGWRFASDGRCTRIPALPALGEGALKGRATTFAVQQCHGLVWVCLPLTSGAEVSVESDRMSLAYRGYLKQQRLRYGVLRDGDD